MLGKIGKKEVFEFDPAVVATKNSDGSGTFKTNAVQWRYIEYIDSEGRDFNVDYRNEKETFVEFAFLEDAIRQSGQLLPVIYKDDSIYSGYEGADYEDIYWYTGKETFNGQTYDRWRKTEDDKYRVDSNSYQYVFTDPIINHYCLFYDFNGNIVNSIIYKDEDSSYNVYTCPFYFYNDSTENASLNYIASSGPSLPLAVMLPESVKQYHYGVVHDFAGNQGMEYLTIPNGYSIIDANALRTTEVTKVDLPSTIKNIRDYAFCESGLQTLRVPNGVTTIGSYAFADCPYLQYAIIPNTVTSMGEEVFNGTYCKIYYEGSSPSLKWPTNWMGDGDVYYYSQTLPTTTLASWYYDEHGQPQQRPDSELKSLLFINANRLRITGTLPLRVSTYRLNTFTVQIRGSSGQIISGIAPTITNAEIISSVYNSSTGSITVEFMPTGPVELDFLLRV